MKRVGEGLQESGWGQKYLLPWKGSVVAKLQEGRSCKDLLRGPVAILFISRDTCSDSIAKLLRACFCAVSHNYRAICCKMGYRTGVPV